MCGKIEFGIPKEEGGRYMYHTQCSQHKGEREKEREQVAGLASSNCKVLVDIEGMR